MKKTSRALSGRKRKPPTDSDVDEGTPSKKKSKTTKRKHGEERKRQPAEDPLFSDPHTIPSTSVSTITEINWSAKQYIMFCWITPSSHFVHRRASRADVISQSHLLENQLRLQRKKENRKARIKRQRGRRGRNVHRRKRRVRLRNQRRKRKESVSRTLWNVRCLTLTRLDAGTRHTK